MTKALIIATFLVFLSWGFTASYYYKLQNEKLRHDATKMDLSAVRAQAEEFKRACAARVEGLMRSVEIESDRAERDRSTGEYFRTLPRGDFNASSGVRF